MNIGCWSSCIIDIVIRNSWYLMRGGCGGCGVAGYGTARVFRPFFCDKAVKPKGPLGVPRSSLRVDLYFLFIICFISVLHRSIFINDTDTDTDIEFCTSIGKWARWRISSGHKYIKLAWRCQVVAGWGWGRCGGGGVCVVCLVSCLLWYSMGRGGRGRKAGVPLCEGECHCVYIYTLFLFIRSFGRPFIRTFDGDRIGY